MSKHTHEPWFLHTRGGDTLTLGGYISQSEGCDGPAITHICGSGFSEDEYRANARRIVACVNACAGVDTDLLEAGELDKPTMLVMQENKDLNLRCYELLVAVEKVFVELERLDASGDVGGWIFEEVELLRSSIAKAKGGAA